MAKLFDVEVKAYHRLKPLQAVVVSISYGWVHYNNTRALLLEHIKVLSLSSPERATLRLEELLALLQPCYRALHAFAVQHDEPNLSNFQLVDGKLMVLELASTVFDLPDDDQAFFFVD